jgi:hypothetical protein
MDGVPVAARFSLRNKPDRRSVRPRSLRIRGFVARPDDNGNLLGSRRERLFDQDAEQRSTVAFSVDEGLEGQGALRPRGGGNDSLLD